MNARGKRLDMLILLVTLCIFGCGDDAKPEPASAGKERARTSVSTTDGVKKSTSVRRGGGAPTEKIQDPSSQKTESSDEVVLSQPDDKTLYTLGHTVMLELAPYQLSERELLVVQKGMRDSHAGELQVNPGEFIPKIQVLGQSRVDARAAKEKRAGELFIASMKKESGAQVAPSGMVYFIEKPGSGPKAQPENDLTVHVRGTLIDGTVIEDTRQQGQPITFPLTKVMPCWIDGFTLLSAGGKAKLVCPPALAFGSSGQAPYVPPESTVIYEIELVSILEPGAAAP